MDITVSIGVGFAVFIAVVWMVLRKNKSIPIESVELVPAQETDVPEIPPEQNLFDRILIGNNPTSPLVTIEALPTKIGRAHV